MHYCFNRRNLSRPCVACGNAGPSTSISPTASSAKHQGRCLEGKWSTVICGRARTFKKIPNFMRRPSRRCESFCDDTLVQQGRGLSQSCVTSTLFLERLDFSYGIAMVGYSAEWEFSIEGLFAPYFFLRWFQVDLVTSSQAISRATSPTQRKCIFCVSLALVTV